MNITSAVLLRHCRPLTDSMWLCQAVGQVLPLTSTHVGKIQLQNFAAAQAPWYFCDLTLMKQAFINSMQVGSCWLQEFVAVVERTNPTGPVVVVTVEPKEVNLLAVLLDANASECQGLLQHQFEIMSARTPT